VRIDIPNRPLHPVAAGAALIPLIIPIILVPWLMDFFRHTNTPGPVGWVFVGFVSLFFGVIPALAVFNGSRRSRRGGTIVRISSEGIEMHQRGAWRTRATASIKTSDILDVDFSTRESSSAAARVAAEQQAMESTGATSVTVGPRTERVIAWLTKLGQGHGLTVKTRTGLTSFGAELEDDEIRYLHDVVCRALRGMA
jgi:hypothetical protein